MEKIEQKFVGVWELDEWVVEKPNGDKTFPFSGNVDGFVIALYLPSNSLRGALPSDFGASLSHLQFLNLQDNYITGSLPASAISSSLRWLVMGDNPLSGSLPDFSNSEKLLQTISLSGTGLTGPLPSSLSSLAELEIMYLSPSSLQGSLPARLFHGLGRLVQLNFGSH